MPQFILDHGSPEASRAFNALDEFTQGYITCMFFTDNAPNAPDVETFMAQCESGENEGSFHRDATVADLAPDTMARIIKDCAEFQTANATLIERALDMSPIYDEGCAGNDFWYSRNGHGTGFWDRGLGEVGDALHKAAQACRGFDTVLGNDGKIHF